MRATMRQPQPPSPTNSIGETALGFVSSSPTTSLRCLSDMTLPPVLHFGSANLPARRPPFLVGFPLFGVAQELLTAEPDGAPAGGIGVLCRRRPVQRHPADTSIRLGHADEAHVPLGHREQPPGEGRGIAADRLLD